MAGKPDIANDSQQQVLCFGSFELNVTAEELRQAGTLVKLPPQPLRLLAVLASRSGEVVSREDIRQQFWGEESEVDFERRVNHCIKQARAALADDANQPTYIETVRLLGYRFLLPVESKTVAIPPPQVREASSSLIGRNATMDLRSRIVGATAQGVEQAGVPEANAAASGSENDGREDAFHRMPARYLAIALAAAAVAAGIVYWYWQK